MSEITINGDIKMTVSVELFGLPGFAPVVTDISPLVTFQPGITLVAGIITAVKIGKQVTINFDTDLGIAGPPPASIVFGLPAGFAGKVGVDFTSTMGYEVLVNGPSLLGSMFVMGANLSLFPNDFTTFTVDADTYFFGQISYVTD